MPVLGGFVVSFYLQYRLKEKRDQSPTTRLRSFREDGTTFVRQPSWIKPLVTCQWESTLVRGGPFRTVDTAPREESTIHTLLFLTLCWNANPTTCSRPLRRHNITENIQSEHSFIVLNWPALLHCKSYHKFKISSNQRVRCWSFFLSCLDVVLFLTIEYMFMHIRKYLQRKSSFHEIRM